MALKQWREQLQVGDCIDCLDLANRRLPRWSHAHIIERVEDKILGIFDSFKEKWNEWHDLKGTESCHMVPMNSSISSPAAKRRVSGTERIQNQIQNEKQIEKQTRICTHISTITHLAHYFEAEALLTECEEHFF